MGDHDWCAAFHGSVQSLLHDFLALLVQGWGSLVKNQDARILDQSSGNSDSLLLATWKLSTFQATNLLETFMQGKLSILLSLSIDSLVLQFAVPLVDNFNLEVW